MNLENALARNGDTLVYFASEKIIASEVPELREALKNELKNGFKHLIIDLSKTKMVDSTGIGLFVALHNAIKKNQGDLVIKNVSKDIFELLQLMKIDQHFTILQT